MDKEKTTLRGILKDVRKRKWGLVSATEVMFADEMIRKLKRLEERIKQNIEAVEGHRNLKKISISYATKLLQGILGKK